MFARFYGIALIGLSLAAGLASFIVTAWAALIAWRLKGPKTVLRRSPDSRLEARAPDRAQAESDRRSLKRQDSPSRQPDANGREELKWTRVFRSRYVILAFPIGFALGLYLILDLALSISIYGPFTVIYVVIWALVVLLLLWRAPARHKLLIVGLLAVVLLSVRAVNWNSRKPFLKDLYRIQKGMTPAQVEQIMGDYMTGGGIPLGSPGTRFDGRLAEQGELATGTISYRHTNEGWGDSDWGVVTFENGRVVEIGFLHD